MPVTVTNPSDWMASIYEAIHQRPLNRIAMPGSHDSATFSIPSSGWGPVSVYAPEAVQVIWELEPSLRPVIAAYARAQSSGITQQLDAGVRVFDFRVQYGNGLLGPSDDYFVYHSLVGGRLLGYLEEIATWLGQHRSEVVIIEISHFYGMGDDPEKEQWGRHPDLLAAIRRIFGDLIASRADYSSDSALEDFVTPNHRALIVYGYQWFVAGGSDPQGWLWSMENARAPGPGADGDIYGWYMNTQKLDALANGLTDQVNGRTLPPSKFFWLFGQFTFGSNIASFDAGFSLEHYAKTTNPAVLSWVLSDWMNSQLNIIALDYVDLIPEGGPSALDVCLILNTEPRGTWTHNTANSGDAPKCMDVYFNTTPLDIPAGMEIVGFQMIHTANDPRYRAGNQIAPVLTVQDPARRDPPWTISDFDCRNAIKGSNDCYANAEPVLCPAGKVIRRFQMVYTKGNPAYAKQNQLVPTLTVTDPRGGHETVLSNFAGGNAHGMKGKHMDTNPLAGPPGTSLRGFTFAYSNKPGFETDNRLLPSVLFGPG
jgi:hypothetical protein